MLKRIIDLILAVLSLAALAPFFALTALLIRLDDGGPVFFRQERLGRQRKPFRVLKFRTMKEQSVTRAGRWLRSRGLDELPQIINVLKGDMSLVGPRPLTAADIGRLGWDRPFYNSRFAVSPGITGLAQIYGGLGRKYSWALDRHYAHKGGLLMDLKIILVSFLINLAGKNIIRNWLKQPRRKNFQKALA